MQNHPTEGVTLLELLVVLTLLGVALAAAAPSLGATLDRYRARSALDRVATDLFYARAYAVRSGRRVQLRFTPPDSCALSYALVRSDGLVLRTVTIATEVGRVCLTSNVPRAMSIDSRGVLIGSARTLRATAGGQADSAVVSLLGRILRARR
jgi:prepilin-type N-terminal cleavage/methylation domain-containing protein